MVQSSPRIGGGIFRSLLSPGPSCQLWHKYSNITKCTHSKKKPGGVCFGESGEQWEMPKDVDSLGTTSSISDIAICSLLIVLLLGLVERPGVSSPPETSHEHRNDHDQGHDCNDVADNVTARAFDVVVKLSTLHTAVSRAVVVSPAQVLMANSLLAVQVATTALATVAIVDDTLLTI